MSRAGHPALRALLALGLAAVEVVLENDLDLLRHLFSSLLLARTEISIPRASPPNAGQLLRFAVQHCASCHHVRIADN